ncbi:MAG: amino acid ABC transporter ATP-binding protein [Bifidobacteriaceae bacterium]|jgi:polar amino acid transport system ATP-binding protein|nr:amino acid ABC transporter ATP-binding protein [Bifidobacteriaceae bacterium]
MTTATPLLELENVHKWYGQRHVLRGIDLRLHQGEVVCVIGPSGSGKSTLLRCINQLEKADAGTISLGGVDVMHEKRRGKLFERSGKDVAAFRQRIGMVFQHFNLFGHMSAVENVMFGPRQVNGVDKVVARARAMELLDMVGLAARASQLPTQLSGGEQQRVAIARCLAMEPEILMFDEATSALDPELVAEVINVMKELARAGTTMIAVTHEMGFARDAADAIVMMDAGLIIEEGPTAEVLNAPRHARTALFLGHVANRPDNRPDSRPANRPDV